MVPHNGGDTLFVGSVQFGTSDEVLELVDDAGHPLSLDKGGRLQRDFRPEDDGARTRSWTRCAKRAPRPHRGVRAGRLPDVRLPARRGARRPHDRARLRRRRGLPQPAHAPLRHHPRVHGRRRDGCVALGWKVVRMSGANFKVWVPLPDGRALRHRRVRVVPHRRPLPRHRFADRHARPLGAGAVRDGDARGREIAAPADAGGVAGLHLRPGVAGARPGVPLRPRPRSTYTRMERSGCAARAAGCASGTTSTRARRRRRVPVGPSLFAQWVQQRLDRARQRRIVLDVGAGTGRDATCFAEQGYAVTGSDYCGVSTQSA